MRQHILSIVSIIIILSLAVGNIHAQDIKKGKIAGKVIDKNTGEEIIGATVAIEGMTIGTSTDIEGRFILSVDPGTYNVLVSYVSYTTKKFEGIEVKSGQVTDLFTSLEESSTQLDEVVVKADFATVVKETEASLLIQQRNAVQISSGVSAEIIKKTPDRTTSDVLKRVSGASIQEGKFAIIRGMADRYNAGYLNGAPLPSTESDRKAFAFDAIPANLIDNLVVLKAGTPDMTGDFGGGVIQITTKSIPTERTQTLNIGGQYHSLTTFKDFKAFNGSSTDFLGVDDGKRKLPQYSEKIDAASDNIDDKVAVTKQFNNDFKINQFNALPNIRLGYSLGLPTKLFGKELGILAAINYNSTYRFSKAIVRDYGIDLGDRTNDFSDNQYNRNINGGALLNLSYKLSPSHIVSVKNLFNVNSDINTILRNGMGNIRDGIAIRGFSDIMTSNQLYSVQLNGDHIIGENWFKIKWLGNYGNINREIPDYRIAAYGAESTTNPSSYPLVGNSNLFSTSSGRFHSELKENIKSGSIDLIKQFSLGLTKNEIKAGVFVQLRDRDFKSKSFTYAYDAQEKVIFSTPEKDLSADSISPQGVYLIDQTDIPTQQYKARSTLLAYYLMFENKIWERLRLVYGARVENFSQEVNVLNANPAKPTEFNTFNVAKQNQIVDLLPSLNINYSVTEKFNIRVAGYKSLNRPEFREISPFSFYRFDINSDVLGNKDLKRASITNYETRFEYYPAANELLSAGAFYKNIIDPIELRYDPEIPTIRSFKYFNEKSALVYGIEFEFRKNFNFLSKIIRPSIVKNIVLFANLAFIKSKVELNQGSTATINRSLQGQSPYVFNVGLQYENPENGWSGSVILNEVGRRIAYVGAAQNIGGVKYPYGFDIYENPRTIVDAQIAKKIKGFDLRFTLGDLLAQDWIFYQDRNKNGNYDIDNIDDPQGELNNDKLIFKYKMGYTVNLAVGYKF